MRLFLIFLLIFGITSCNRPIPNRLIIGTVAGPESELVETAKKIAAQKYGLDIQIIEFNDYNLLNEALDGGNLDANIFQHAPYLQNAINHKGYQIQAIGKTFVYPMAIYSKRWQQLNAIPQGAIIAIPNDPSNEARALNLLQQAKLITLKATQHALISDIASNPKQLNIKELDAAQLPRVLNDVDCAVINMNYAISAELHPKTSLFQENKDAPYANLIVIKQNSEKKEQLNQFVAAMHEQSVKDKAKIVFDNAALPAW